MFLHLLSRSSQPLIAAGDGIAINVSGAHNTWAQGLDLWHRLLIHYISQGSLIKDKKSQMFNLLCLCDHSKLCQQGFIPKSHCGGNFMARASEWSDGLNHTEVKAADVLTVSQLLLMLRGASMWSYTLSADSKFATPFAFYWPVFRRSPCYKLCDFHCCVFICFVCRHQHFTVSSMLACCLLFT